jgi:hypothetical protein
MGSRLPIRHSRTARAARFLGALSLPVLVLSGLGHRFGVVPPEAMLALLIAGFSVAVAALVLAAAASILVWNSGDEGAGDAFAGLIYAAPALVVLGLVLYALFTYPRINDVTTDAEDPPQFWSIEAAAPDEIPFAQAELQHDAYPEVAARLYPLAIERVYDGALATARRRGWQVTLEIPPAEPDSIAKIEAIARTLLFAFRDAVAVRIASTGDGTRVDVRSTSLIGEHDLGQNARRVEAFLDQLDAELQGDFEEVAPVGEELPQEPTEVPGS